MAFFTLSVGTLGFALRPSYRRPVEICEGAHSLHLEMNRLQVFQAVQGFLKEDYAPVS